MNMDDKHTYNSCTKVRMPGVQELSSLVLHQAKVERAG